ncbi:MAG: UDP-N-acetylmuramate--L-alanine ligase [bacterium]
MKTYFVGIGGSGVSSLAWLCLDRGWEVEGSDKSPSQAVERLMHAGARIHLGHSEQNLEAADRFVHTTAVNGTNPELNKAKAMGMTIQSRAEFLADLFREKAHRVAVTGSHGKTTTSGLIAYGLMTMGLDPAAIVGGDLVNWDRGGRWGNGDVFVAEADESRDSFLLLSPTILVITNLDADHLDFYRDLNHLTDTLKSFTQRPISEALWISADDPNLHALIEESIARGLPIRTFGISATAMLRGEITHQTAEETTFRVSWNGEPIGEYTLHLPGDYNVRNALAAIGVFMALDTPRDPWPHVISTYKGINRRFQKLGEWNNILFYSDYAHHPTEIQSLLSAARRFNRRVVAVFQPHRYSRTQHLGKELGLSLISADVVIVTDLFTACEKPIPGVSSESVAVAARSKKPQCVHFVNSKDDLFVLLDEVLMPGDIALFIGAGDIHQWGVEFAARCGKP